MPAEYVLSFYPDSKCAAVAGSGSCMYETSAASYYNPALIAANFYQELTVFYAPLYYVTKFMYVSYSYPLAPKETVLASVEALSSDGIEKTNSLGETLYGFSSLEYTISLNYAFFVSENTSFGMAVKMLSQDLDDYSARAFSADVGLFVDSRDTRYAVSVRNCAPLKFSGDKLPMSLRLGLYQDIIESFSAMADVSFDDLSNKPIIRHYLGVEYRFKAYRIRGGINYKEFACGAGLMHEKYSMDYAVTVHPLNITHKISVALRFGVEPSEAEKCADKKLKTTMDKIQAEESRIAEERQRLDKDMKLFIMEKEKIEALAMNDKKLKQAWENIQQEKQKLLFDMQIMEKRKKYGQMYDKAEMLFNEGKYTEALRIAEELLRENSADAAAKALYHKINDKLTGGERKLKYMQAVNLYNMEKYKDAFEKAKEALAIDPNYTEAALLMYKADAQNDIQQKVFWRAKDKLVEALKNNPDDAEIIELIGKVQTILDVLYSK